MLKIYMERFLINIQTCKSAVTQSTMNESSTDVLVLNEQTIPDRPLEEVMPLEEFIPLANDEQSTEAVSAGLRELATRFLDIQSPNANGLTIDYVKSIRSVVLYHFYYLFFPYHFRLDWSSSIYHIYVY